MFKPAGIVFKKTPQIRNAILEHGQAFNAHSKGKPLVLFRVESAVLENLQVHHTAAANFKPIVSFSNFKGA